jgi:hypothetical protein
MSPHPPQPLDEVRDRLERTGIHVDDRLASLAAPFLAALDDFIAVVRAHDVGESIPSNSFDPAWSET